MANGISIGEGLFWVLAWFGVMLLYTLLDVAVWRKAAPRHARLLNLISVAVCMGGFLILLKPKSGFRLDLADGVTLPGLLLAAGCAAALYFLLDKFLDPILEGMMPGSEERYQETLRSLRGAPVISFLQVCILAPFMEEILMRGFLLGGLAVGYGKTAALLLSSAVFALLHFNMVQTLSAMICGIVLGLLYIRTGSILCCITAHAGYNMISYFTTITTPHGGCRPQPLPRGEQGGGAAPPLIYETAALSGGGFAYHQRLHSRSVYPDGSSMGSPAISFA